MDPRRSSSPSFPSFPSDLSDPSFLSDPPRGDRRAWWRLGLRGWLGVALAVIASVAVAGLFWIRARRPPAIEPFPPAASGVVLSGAWMGTTQGEAFCDALEEALGSEAVRCLSFASRQADDPGVRARARRAGAMVVALVGGEGAARVFPLGLFQGDPLLGGEFLLDVGRVETRKRTVAMLAALARVARPGQGSAPHEVPCPPVGHGPFDRLTLLEQLFVPSCAREAIAPQRLLEVCDAPASDADDCGLARSLYVARCPTCSEARAALTWLKEQARPRFRPMAAVQLARMDCEAGKLAEASAALRALAEEPSACVEIAIAAVAACIVSTAGSVQVVHPEIRALEQTPILDRLECPPVLRTHALGQRAYYRARARQWVGAEADYRAAFTLSHEPLYELSRIELLLRQRHRAEAGQALVALEHLEIADPPAQAYAALLRWIAARDAGGPSVTLDAAALLDLYRALPTAARALGGDAGDEDLRALACPPSADAPCAYDILARPKTSTSAADLERALASEGPANAEPRPVPRGPANAEPRPVPTER